MRCSYLDKLCARRCSLFLFLLLQILVYWATFCTLNFFPMIRVLCSKICMYILLDSARNKFLSSRFFSQNNKLCIWEGCWPNRVTFSIIYVCRTLPSIIYIARRWNKPNKAEQYIVTCAVSNICLVTYLVCDIIRKSLSVPKQTWEQSPSFFLVVGLRFFSFLHYNKMSDT